MKQRIYIVGAGAIAGYHAEAIARLTETESERALLYVTDVNPSALAAFAEKYPWAVPVEHLDTMLDEPAEENDIVIVATPPLTHAEISCRALRSGRHVLCEKPLAMNKEEAALMLITAREAGKMLGCCSSRFAGLEITAGVKELLEQGRIGELYQVQWIQRRKRARTGIEYQPTSRWFLNRAISGGGTLMDWGPYDIASLTEVLQPQKVEVLHAWTTNPETNHPHAVEIQSDVEQHVGALLRFHLADGSIVPVHYERAACCHGSERSLTEIEGTAGALQWDWLCFDGSGELVHHYDMNGDPAKNRSTISNEGLGMMDKPIVYFLRAISGQHSPAIVNEQAVFNFSILAAIYDCAHSGEGQVVAMEGI
ncbi:Gfo/Idh/MocA family protein [Paenibacillus sp. FJAT-27812]|uniref:Gfo/Idh/MocA family protein n=1 Tax=Paenibacillus sp. FJAT-27812 TaxID=1684143 RepID=UPI0006A7A18C|nr:Gfo/Idh/MocA family oxidoreductase [Paenibacillus sp. FJAT-27812]